MARVTLFPGGSAAVGNPDYAYEPIGVGTGTGLQLTAGSSQAKGSWIEFENATAEDWSGFTLQLGIGSSTSNRYLVDVGTGAAAAEVAILPNLYIQPSTLQGFTQVRIPLQIPSGTRVAMRCSSSANGGTIYASINGWQASATNPPGFTTATQLIAVDTVNVRPSSTSVTSEAAGTTWTELVASTAAEYGALVVSVGENATPLHAQGLRVSLATGAAASEVAFGGGLFQSGTANPLCARAILPIIEKTIPASSRISMNIMCADVSTSADTFFPQVIGFS